MNAYDLSHLTDAQLYELRGRLIEELEYRREQPLPRPDRGSGNMTAYNVALCKRIADKARMQVSHYPPADKPPPQPIFNHYTE